MVHAEGGRADLTKAPILAIQGRDELLKTLQDKQRKLVVVKFWTHGCRACRTLDRKFSRLALEMADETEVVEFFEVDYTVNAGLCHELGVRQLPHINI